MWAMLRSNRDLRWLFIAQVISYCGDWFAYVAFVGLIQEHSDSKVLVSLVLVSTTLPSFLMSPLAGSVADRFDRRKILIVTSCAQAAAAAGLLTVSGDRLWLGYVCLLCISALAAFTGPAAGAAVPNLARNRDEMRLASTLFGSLWGAMVAVGAGLGGLFAALFGRTASFVADAISFVAAAGMVMLIRTAMQTRDATVSRPPIRPLADMGEALTAARRDPVILAFLSSKMVFTLGSSALVGLLAAFAHDELQGGDGATGLLIAARGVGAAIGPVIAMRFADGRLSRVQKVCAIGGIATGIAYGSASFAPHLAVAAAFVFGAHLFGGSQWTLSTYGLQVRAPDAIRGRILAGDFALATLTIGLSGSAGGLLADRIGIRPTFLVFGGVAITTGLAYLLATRGVRRALRVEESTAMAAMAHTNTA